AAASMTREPPANRQPAKKVLRLEWPDLQRRRLSQSPGRQSGSDQEERHQDQNDDDRQQRDFDEPGKPDPGPAMPFEFWVNRRHRRLARGERCARDIAEPQREASAPKASRGGVE